MNYLTSNYLLLSNLIGKSAVSSDMRTYLEESCYDLVQPWGKARFYDSPDALNMYISSHYDQLSTVVGKDTDRFARFVGSDDQSLFNAVAEMLDDNIRGERQVALDVGANVGGMTWRLAQRYGYVYGIDTALATISTARRVLLHMPTRMARYRLYQEGRRFEYRDLAIERQRNIELLAASGLAMPFADAHFDLVNCSNVIDVVSDPEGLITELDRTLKPGGLMVMTDPYRWELGDTEIENWIEGDEGGASAEALVDALNGRGYEILEERDMVPWLLRRYRRHYSVWLNHCVIARKQLQ
ncbi:MAG: class I SAM-dependent methyltransferase [Chloroflexota bacterium]